MAHHVPEEGVDEALEVYSYFAEHLPRVSAFQVAFATREACKLSFSSRRVFVTRNAGGLEEEICHWPPDIPALDPGSCLNRNHCTAGPLQLRFQSRDRNVAGASKNVPDPHNLSAGPPNIVICCGFCSQIITPPNQ